MDSLSNSNIILKDVEPTFSSLKQFLQSLHNRFENAIQALYLKNIKLLKSKLNISIRPTDLSMIELHLRLVGIEKFLFFKHKLFKQI